MWRSDNGGGIPLKRGAFCLTLEGEEELANGEGWKVKKGARVRIKVSVSATSPGVSLKISAVGTESSTHEKDLNRGYTFGRNTEGRRTDRIWLGESTEKGSEDRNVG